MIQDGEARLVYRLATELQGALGDTILTVPELKATFSVQIVF
jgi:hypothetical protein